MTDEIPTAPEDKTGDNGAEAEGGDEGDSWAERNSWGKAFESWPSLNRKIIQ